MKDGSSQLRWSPKALGGWPNVSERGQPYPQKGGCCSRQRGDAYACTWPTPETLAVQCYSTSSPMVCRQPPLTTPEALSKHLREMTDSALVLWRQGPATSILAVLVRPGLSQAASRHAHYRFQGLRGGKGMEERTQASTTTSSVVKV